MCQQILISSKYNAMPPVLFEFIRPYVQPKAFHLTASSPSTDQPTPPVSEVKPTPPEVQSLKSPSPSPPRARVYTPICAQIVKHLVVSVSLSTKTTQTGNLDGLNTHTCDNHNVIHFQQILIKCLCALQLVDESL